MKTPDVPPSDSVRPAARGDRRYPLHIHLACIIILLILLTGAVITWTNYYQSSEAIESSAGELFARTERAIVGQIMRSTGPIESLLSVAVHTHLATASTREDRRSTVLLAIQILRQSSVMPLLVVGYPNGDALLVRKMEHPAVRELFQAPPEAAYLVQEIERSAGGQADGRNEFLDTELRSLGSRQQEGPIFDPRTRPWFQQAQMKEGVVFVDPYVFFSTREIGCTLAIRAPASGAVIGADVSLSDLSALLAAEKPTSSSEIVIFDRQGGVIAYTNPSRLTQKKPSEDNALRASRLGELGSPAMSWLADFLAAGVKPGKITFEQGGTIWLADIRKRSFSSGSEFYHAVLIPRDELLAGPIRARETSLMLAGGMLVFAMPLGWWVARRISQSLRRLENEAQAIQYFDFRERAPVSSAIQEIDSLAVTMDSMKSTIREFLGVTSALAAEDDFSRLRDLIVDDTLVLTGADAGALLLVSDDGALLMSADIRWRAKITDTVTLPECSLSEETVDIIAEARRTSTASYRRISRAESLTAAGYLRDYLSVTDAENIGILAVPLMNREKVLVGMLMLFENNGTSGGIQSADRVSFIEALSGFAAVSIETQQLVKAQKELLESLIRLLAGAIDAKSPYTGGHCQRVPVIARMLAEAAVAATDGPYRDFQLSDKEWELLHISSWLHDCGKITTPEYVVDKATKLETIYDRIHEIRMRFEVLKRDAGLEYWQRRTEGGDLALLAKELRERIAELDEEYTFIAACNEGGEYLDPEKVERIKAIAARTWMRTLDDRIGISEEEKQHRGYSSGRELPAVEPLLSDKEEHLIRRTERDTIPSDNPWGFRLDEPEFLYNRGEVHNLGINRGTLTLEERHKINDHIVQTIIMLSELPFPKHLRSVPEVAGGHHEKMDGTGYPKRLQGSDMSPLARIMAIADIFEALTATDRPYKKGKTLSESLRIMSSMNRDHHIDSELFELFLKSGVYLRYARQYLQPDQIDDVDISGYIRK